MLVVIKDFDIRKSEHNIIIYDTAITNMCDHYLDLWVKDIVLTGVTFGTLKGRVEVSGLNCDSTDRDVYMLICLFQATPSLNFDH